MQMGEPMKPKARWTACLLFVLLAGCYDSTGITYYDAGDAGYEDTIDTHDPGDTSWDTPADTPPDTRPDVWVDPDVPCTYPPGPYSFNRVGDTVGPCSWPTAVSGEDETLPADFEALYCDPDIQSVFVFMATSTDPYSPALIDELLLMTEHYRIYGAKWVWILVDADSALEAGAYFEELGVTFGWMTNDADNSMGRYALAGTPMAFGVPWIGVIDAETMKVTVNNPVDVFPIVENLGTD